MHRRARDLKRERRKRSPLRVVQPGEAPALPAGDAGELAPASDSPAAEVGSIREALREDLAAVFSKHPAARTLERVAGVLALVLDTPAIDARVVPAVSKELRSIVQELIKHEEPEEDDLFGGAGPVVVGG